MAATTASTIQLRRRFSNDVSLEVFGCMESLLGNANKGVPPGMAGRHPLSPEPAEARRAGRAGRRRGAWRNASLAISGRASLHEQDRVRARRHAGEEHRADL